MLSNELMKGLRDFSRRENYQKPVITQKASGKFKISLMPTTRCLYDYSLFEFESADDAVRFAVSSCKQ